jgi:hypothetical protein
VTRDFSFLQTCSRPHPTSYQMGMRGSFPGTKGLTHETDHSPPFSAEVNCAGMPQLTHTSSRYGAEFSTGTTLHFTWRSPKNIFVRRWEAINWGASHILRTVGEHTSAKFNVEQLYSVMSISMATTWVYEIIFLTETRHYLFCDVCGSHSGSYTEYHYLLERDAVWSDRNWPAFRKNVQTKS